MYSVYKYFKEQIITVQIATDKLLLFINDILGNVWVHVYEVPVKLFPKTFFHVTNQN